MLGKRAIRIKSSRRTRREGTHFKERREALFMTLDEGKELLEVAIFLQGWTAPLPR